jgi:hypothetical protein
MATVTNIRRIDPAAVVTAVHDAWSEFLLAERGPSQSHPYCYASAYRECDRRIVLEMTQPDKMAPFEPDTLANFRRGNDRERDLLADLKRIGRNCSIPFEVIGEQERFEIRDSKQRVAIVGKVDARLKFADRTSAPLEVKNWNQNIAAGLHIFEDVLRGTWTKAGAYQLLAYMYGANEPCGFLLLDRAGIPKLIPVELYPNMDMMAEFIAKASGAMDHLEAGTLPAFIDDASECKRCPFFGSICNPPISGGAGAKIITDPEVEHMLERREECEDAYREYKSIDDEIKKRYRGTEYGIAGRFLLQGKWGKQTSYDIPDHIKAPYKHEDPKGRFTLTITRTS